MSRRDKFGVRGLFTCMALLVSLPASAGPVLSVSTQSVTVQGTVGSNLSTTMQVANNGNGALKWSVAVASGGADWLSVSPTSGVNTKPLTLTFRTGVPAGQYQTTFTVSSGTSSMIVSVQMNLAAAAVAPPPTPPTAPTLTVSCPANSSVASTTGSGVVVNYTATASGGIAPISVNGSPASGSTFPVGTTTVSVTAQSSDGQTARCSFTVTVTYTAPSVSPDGAMVPTTTSQIVDNTGAVWTIGSNLAILRNGTQAAGGSGSKIYWKNSTIYVLGTDNMWWRWTGSGWVNIGPTAP